jgi:1-phosphatidylinositol-4-phosphate 5-kinase
VYRGEAYIVLENLLDVDVPIHRVYDLKGSTQGRSNPGGRGVFKDLDLVDRLQLGKNLPRVLEQIRVDSEVSSLPNITGADCPQFLESMDIIDYSLMVGVHYLDQHEKHTDQFFRNFSRTRSRKRASNRFSVFHQEYHGGLLSENKQEIYFLGIVDHLTTYDLRKRGETFAKRLFLSLGSVSDISCVPPVEYSNRFRQFIRSVCD